MDGAQPPRLALLQADSPAKRAGIDALQRLLDADRIDRPTAVRVIRRSGLARLHDHAARVALSLRCRPPAVRRAVDSARRHRHFAVRCSRTNAKSRPMPRAMAR
jgi:hypothetical protein